MKVCYVKAGEHFELSEYNESFTEEDEVTLSLLKVYKILISGSGMFIVNSTKRNESPPELDNEILKHLYDNNKELLTKMYKRAYDFFIDHNLITREDEFLWPVNIQDTETGNFINTQLMALK